MPGDEGPPPYEVLAALGASLRRELAEAAGALEQARAELADARCRLINHDDLKYLTSYLK